MKAFLLAAGLGTRLRPWTEHHPKALVPVAGVPMLKRVVLKLKEAGFNRLTLNVHHFADQIVDYVDSNDFGVTVSISDESRELLDTGGGLLAALPSLSIDNTPFLVHNVDILSDAPLGDIMAEHIASGNDISLVTSPRDSSRKLLFDTEGRLKGWHNLKTGEYRPEGFRPSDDMVEMAFSGIYVVNPSVADSLRGYSDSIASRKFPIMDFLMHNTALLDSDPLKVRVAEIRLPDLNLIDIGKPETLQLANESEIL